MSKYVMSDLHGCYEKFIKMLEQIQFNNNDELYILGDVFDRGDKPLEILDYIINHKNITLLKGNHEKMFDDCYKSKDTSNIAMWMYNGGSVTFEAILNKGEEYEKALYDYISKLPFIKVVDNFILVHAGLHLPLNYKDLSINQIINLQEEETCLWDRDNIGHERKIDGYSIIVGHTPVQSIVKDYDVVKILHRNGTYYIDCGCVFEKANGKLACIRLEDLKEFYV